MKKRYIAVILIATVLLLLGGLYWFGYLQFKGNLPVFTTNPKSTQQNDTTEHEGTYRVVIQNIRGRINKISAIIKNDGDQDAKSLNWSIKVTGGILKRIDMRSLGSITTLSTQSETTITSDRIPLGLGRLEITVTVEIPDGTVVTQTAKGFKLFFFVIGVRT